MAAVQSVDDVLVCLMSMGFDFQDCQDAVQNGKVTVEMAVEWLLAGKPGKVSQSEQPKLTLRQDASQFEEGTNPFSNPNPVPSGVPKAEEAVAPSEGAAADDGQLDNSVMSRLHLSDEQRKVKQRFEMKQIEEARQEALKDKLRRKRDHARILKEIQGDREKQKLIHTAPEQAVAAGPSSTKPSTDQAEVGSAQTEVSKPQDSKCLIQVRLPGGQVVRKTFQAATILAELRDFIQANHTDLTGMCFMQPFPHKEFGDAEMTQTFQELGLVPSGSLVVQKKEINQSIASTGYTPSVSSGSAGQGGAGGHSNAVMNLFGGGLALDAGPEHPLPGTRWGKGYKMSDESPEQQDDAVAADNAGDDDEDEMEEDEDIGPAGMMGHPFGGHVHHGLGPMGHAMAAGGGLNFGGDFGGAAFQGVGQRMVPEGNPQFDENYHQRPAGELAAEKARERYALPQVDKEPERLPTTVSYSVQKLLSQCLQHVARKLRDPQDHLHSLGGISEDLAQKLLEYLIKNKLLTPKLLQAFVPCYLRNLVLDCYPLASNDMLNSVRLHHQLVHLSLKSCPLITDAGLKPLIILKKLRYLSLSGCKQISDKSFATINEMKALNALLLEGTGVTDEGIREYISTKPQTLQHLNLNSTQVTESIIPDLKELPQLKSLYLEHTEVCGLSGIQFMSNLETLDIAHTNLVTDSLLCLRDIASLTCLGISHTNKVTGDLALQYISGLNLQALNLPSRHSTTDKGMQYITKFNLTTLDLTNYVYIGDEGMQHIGSITCLKKLLLSNTKITDAGMMYLEGLKLLEVLYLDRTNITDEGASVIKGFTALRELSLSSTNITSRLITQQTLSFCVSLTKLNLSRTRVTQKGLKCLRLPYLQLLNLDGTSVSPHIHTILELTCPQLKSVTATNLLPVVSDEED